MSLALLTGVVLGGAACCCYTSGSGYRGRTGELRGGGGQLVRVRLSAFTAVATVSCDAGLWLRAAGAARRVEHQSALLRRVAGSVAVEVGGREWKRAADTVVLQGTQDAFIRVGDRAYRGTLLAFVSRDGELVVVNVLPLEEYLCGVVACEIGPLNSETYEAVKAQAVAARSFTITRLSRRRGLGFQLYDTYLRDQEYRGVSGESELASRAVADTRGEVLLCRGEVAEALYHANCGGVTGTGSQPYLKSVRDAPGHRPGGRPFCSSSKHFTWDVSLGREVFEERLGRIVGTESRPRVRSCRAEKERSGRIVRLRFATDGGELKISGTDFRMGLDLKSTLFDMKLERDRVKISGRGWGHGLGMCQDGAIAMARRGCSYRQILLHYYSSVKLSRCY